MKLYENEMLSSNQVAWMLPVAILAHQLKEYLGGFPLWYSNLLNAQLSNQDFILINAVGLFLFTSFSLSYYFHKNKAILVAIGTLVLVNGIIHLSLSIFTFTYSPGSITGAILFLPLGVVIFKKILPQLGETEKFIAIAIGILVLIFVSLIAMNM